MLARSEARPPAASRAERARLVEAHLPLCAAAARGLLRRLRPGLLEFGDCVQAASLALVQCAERFDDSKGVPFDAYVRPRLRGAVLDLLRAELRSRPHAAQRLADRARHLEPSAPDRDELDDFLAMVADLGLGLMLESAAVLDSATTDAHLYAALKRDLVRQVEQLPERLRALVRQHYFQHVPFADIARDWALTPGRISQLHSDALRKLKTTLEM